VRRDLAAEMQMSYRVSERRACSGLGFPRSTHRYQSVADPQEALRMRLRDLATSRVGYGYRRLHILLRREGWAVNHKRILRLYREEGLVMRRKPPRRRVSCAKRQGRSQTTAPNERWSMDFLSDELYDGSRIRVLTLVDNHSRESLAIRVARRIRGRDVAAALESVSWDRGHPEVIQVDNGPEFLSKDMDFWAYFNGVKLDFSRPGNPTDNALVESFNGRLRQECLNAHWFLSVADAQRKVDAWRWDYNHRRPHSSLGGQVPAEFAQRCAAPSSATLQPAQHSATR